MTKAPLISVIDASPALDRAPDLPPRFILNMGSMLCRRGMFQTVGRFDPSLLCGEDADWFKRLQEAASPIQQSPEPALIYRVRPENMTYARAVQTLGWTQMARRAIQRRRAAGQ
ncbi:MAG: hypothetical protein KF832_17275 [Caldilineaceae bacterium]|nr:hypothetical protein [Caldilineaceae bacterium]